MFFAHNARKVAGVFFLVLVAACSTPQTKALRLAAPVDLPPRVEISDVVFYPQERYQCGPASLAMVMQKAGVSADPAQLSEFLYLPQKQGSLQVEMLAATRRNGLLAYVLRPQLHDVLTEIAAGNPVIVLQNLALSWYPMWHYAVVIGYDLQTEEIILRSGTTHRLLLPFSTFEHTWARSQYWAMVALPTSKLPHTATPENTIQSIAALTHSNASVDVWPAYDAAMQRWPDNLLSNIAAGNFAYQRGNLKLAEHIFFIAAQQHPDSVAALNNLAQTLSDLGQYTAALDTVQRAIELGGSLAPTARQTMAEIEQKKRAAQGSALK